MITKKISLLVVVFTMITNVCFAANWVWLSSNDETSIYFDSDTCEISNGVLSFLEKDVDTNGKYVIVYKEYSDGELASYDYVFYNSDDVIIEKGKINTSHRIVPGSKGEDFIKTVASYCK